MKISEVLNPAHKEVSPEKGIHDRKSYVGDRAKEIGHGVFGRAVTSTNPHEVIKMSSVGDNYNFFVTCVLAYNKEHGSMNPYFPKFSKIVTFKDKWSERASDQRKTIRMERLHPLRNYTAKELAQVGISLFGKDEFFDLLRGRAYPAIDEYQRKYDSAPTVLRYDLEQAIETDKQNKHGEYVARDSCARAIADGIRSVMNHKNEMGIIKDYKLVDAVQWLRKCVINKDELNYDRHISTDMHSGNIMIRREGGHLQIVITDPFS